MLEAGNGRRHQLRGEYLFLMPAAGMDLELEKKPATP